ncbi:MAG: hypothetical protein E5V92_00290 [Mesorhizobium sp.]|nr:MAG: hypothetical protein E5V92_00290 [Mesorhizobium sp.]
MASEKAFWCEPIVFALAEDAAATIENRDGMLVGSRLDLHCRLIPAGRLWPQGLSKADTCSAFLGQRLATASYGRRCRGRDTGHFDLTPAAS